MRNNGIAPIHLLIQATTHEQIHLNAPPRPFSMNEFRYTQIDIEPEKEGVQVTSIETEGFKLNIYLKDGDLVYPQYAFKNFGEGYTEWVNREILLGSNLPIVVQGVKELGEWELTIRLFASAAERLGLTPQNTWDFHANSDFLGIINFIGKQGGYEGEEAEIYGARLAFSINEMNPDEVFQILSEAKK